MQKTRCDDSLASCEILSPAGFSPELDIHPNGPEVLMLLSGKMQLLFDNHTVDMRYGKPVVIHQPYRVVCPQGPGTGRALRVAVGTTTCVRGTSPKKTSLSSAKTTKRRTSRNLSLS